MLFLKNKKKNCTNTKSGSVWQSIGNAPMKNEGVLLGTAQGDYT